MVNIRNFSYLDIMYHYILLFINKVLYYIRIPLHIETFCDFCDCDFVSGMCFPPDPPKGKFPRPSERRGALFHVKGHTIDDN